MELTEVGLSRGCERDCLDTTYSGGRMRPSVTADQAHRLRSWLPTLRLSLPANTLLLFLHVLPGTSRAQKKGRVDRHLLCGEKNRAMGGLRGRQPGRRALRHPRRRPI